MYLGVCNDHHTTCLTRRKTERELTRSPSYPQAMPAPYKPSPLSYGSQRERSSPFRRPESPATASSPRQTTPSPTKQPVSSRFASTTPTQESENRTPRARFGSSAAVPVAETSSSSQLLGSPAHITASSSPSRPLPTPMASSTTTSHPQSLGHGNALSQLQPAQVRVLRDSFQILDRDGDGSVNREDVADMLGQLGNPALLYPLNRHNVYDSRTQCLELLRRLHALPSRLSPSSLKPDSPY